MSIAERLAEVRRRLTEAAGRAGRSADEVRLIAVSKTFPASFAEEAYAAGQRDFGENRLQELLEKKSHLPMDCRWHLIGPLQRNKVRKALAAGIQLIHAVDSMEVAGTISRIASEISAAGSNPVGGERGRRGEQTRVFRGGTQGALGEDCSTPDAGYSRVNVHSFSG